MFQPRSGAVFVHGKIPDLDREPEIEFTRQKKARTSSVFIPDWHSLLYDRRH